MVAEKLDFKSRRRIMQSHSSASDQFILLGVIKRTTNAEILAAFVCTLFKRIV